MNEFLEYCKKHPLEAKLYWTFLNVHDETPLETLKERLLDLMEDALELDPLSRELLTQAAVKKLKKLKFPQPRKLVDIALKEAEKRNEK